MRYREIVNRGFVLSVVIFSACRASDSPEGGSSLLRGVLWKAPDSPAGSESGWSGTPRVVGGTVYVIRRQAIVALNAASGHELWRHTIAHDGVRIPRAILASDASIYVAAGDSIFALDAASGSARWSTASDIDYSECDGTLDNKAIYLCSFDYRAAAYDRATGARLWSVVLSPSTQLPAQVYGSLLSGDTLYVTSRRDLDKVHRFAEITALDRRSGTELWRWNSKDSSNSALGSPVLVGNLLVADDEDGNAIFAVDRFTQIEKWRVKGDPGAFGPKGTPALIGDTAYVASADRFVYAIHVPTGKVIWQSMGQGSYLSVAACGNSVYANDFGIDVRDRKSGRLLDRILASRENADYAIGGIGTDGIRIYVTSYIATYAIKC